MQEKQERNENWPLGKLILLALLGFLLGVSLKNVATEKFTMGYEDYKLEKLQSDFSLK